MNPRQKARYTAGLESLATARRIRLSQQAQRIAEAEAHEMDTDEVAAGRKRKRTKVPTQPAQVAAPVAGPASGTLAVTPIHAPGPATVLLQHGNTMTSGSNTGRGRKTREDFIAQSIHAAVAGARPRSLDRSGDMRAIGPDTQAPHPTVPEVHDEDMADAEDELDDESDREPDNGPMAIGRPNRAPAGTTADKGQEEPMAPEPFDQDGAFICTVGPKRREESAVILAGYIRGVVFQLMRRHHVDDPLPHGPPPEIAAPTARAFYVRWHETETSLFNATAIRIITKQVLKDWPGLFADKEDEVSDSVTSHIKYLKMTYRRENEPELMAKEPARLLRCNANTRRHTLYNHRIQIILAIPALHKHGRFIQTLGPEGMSSDEEDPDHPGVYIIKRRKELSNKANHLKGQLDQAFVIRFKGPGSKGNQCRKRVDYGAVSKRPFMIEGLPLSCINQEWYNSLTDIQKELFNFRDHEYDYSFPHELLQPLP